MAGYGSKTIAPAVAAGDLESLWSRHNAVWRDCAQVTSQWEEATATDPSLLKHRVYGNWWGVLEKLKITLLIGREYEHLVLAASCVDKPSVTYMPMPHPSGIVADREGGSVYVASTRNPNQIFELAPVSSFTDRLDKKHESYSHRPLVPVRSTFFPGCLYMHDLAMVGGKLHANAVGQNAIIQINLDGSYKPVWWPKCIEPAGKGKFGQNYIQLNSIAAGPSIKESFFSASSANISRRRPGHKNYPVDKRGVIFSGQTREPYAHGLTRPHSARLHDLNGASELFVDNSGYGEFGYIEDGLLNVVAKLPGWTRGLAFCKNIAFVGTSRVIPKFKQYAPGLDVDASICGVHAVDLKTGEVLGSIVWPSGNQIFAIDWLPVKQSSGFPFLGTMKQKDNKSLFYTFMTDNHSGLKKEIL